MIGTDSSVRHFTDHAFVVAWAHVAATIEVTQRQNVWARDQQTRTGQPWGPKSFDGGQAALLKGCVEDADRFGTDPVQDEQFFL